MSQKAKYAFIKDDCFVIVKMFDEEFLEHYAIRGKYIVNKYGLKSENMSSIKKNKIIEESSIWLYNKLFGDFV
jgi:hypothetical protein